MPALVGSLTGAMELSWFELVAALTAVVVGAAVQGSIGFGMNLVAVPVLALLDPSLLPATLVLAGLPVSILMIRREHHAIDRRGLAWIFAGRIPGTVLGAWVVSVASPDALSAIVGATVTVAAVMSSRELRIRVNARTSATAGFASGTMGTAAAIGGPPLALLYQRHDGPVLRSTLAASFLLGTAFSVAALTFADQVGSRHVVMAGVLTPAIAVGIMISSRVTAIVDGRWLRPAVLGVAIVAGVAAILRGVA